ncbi:MAG: caspase family protein [Muribaculaceae bacterium]
MKLIRLWLTLIVAMTIAAMQAGPLHRAGSTRRALVIGLGAQLDKSWSKINGDNDVEPVAQMLRAVGFTHIKQLTNEEATKAAIVKALNALIARADTGDVVYIHFSGHGQLMTDVNGDEDDGYDESWIPYDAYRKPCAADRGDKHLSDDELAGYMSRLRDKVGRDGIIAVVVDACHSGDSTRDAIAEADSSLVIRGVYDTFDIAAPSRRARAAKVPERWLTLSACKDYQLNQEYQGHGKLTHILTSSRSAYSGKTDAEILRLIDETMQSRRYKGRLAQSPMLTGTIGNALSIILGK